MAIALPQVTTDANGTAYIDGTATKVIEVVLNKQMGNLTPEELTAQMPHLTLAQVYVALAYYHAHQTGLDAEIEERREWVATQQAQKVDPLLRSALLARAKIAA